MNIIHQKLFLPCCFIIVFILGVMATPSRTQTSAELLPAPPILLPPPAEQVPITPTLDEVVRRFADAIYWSEGGPKTKTPYGVMSKRPLTVVKAREVCERTIVNTILRWRDAGAPGRFIEFLGNRYCPPSTDPVGYVNWIKNVQWFLDHPKAP